MAAFRVGSSTNRDYPILQLKLVIITILREYSNYFCIKKNGIGSGNMTDLGCAHNTTSALTTTT